MRINGNRCLVIATLIALCSGRAASQETVLIHSVDAKEDAKRNAGAAGSQDLLKDRFVLAGDEAYGLLPPELVCGPQVMEAKWSPDGRYVLAVCHAARVAQSLAKLRALARDPGEPPGDLSLIVWSRESHRSREVWRRPLVGSRVEEFRWLPGSDKAVAVVQETVRPVVGLRREVIWVRAEADSARLVAEIPFDLQPPGWVTSPLNYVEISPTQPLALIVNWHILVREAPRADGKMRTVHQYQYDLTPIRENGSPAPTVHLPLDIIPIVWSEDGSTHYLEHIDSLADPKQRSTPTWFEFDPQTGKVKQLPAEPPNFRALMEARDHRRDQAGQQSTGAVRLASCSSEIKIGDTVTRLRPLWLEGTKSSEQPRALISSDVTWAQFSPSADAVLYFSHGAAWVRPLLRVTIREYAAMLNEEARRQAVADAKELAQALQRQVGDAEYYPTLDKLSAQLGPYLTNKGLLDRIVLTYPGKALPTNPEEWPTTQLGFVNGPGGRAIIYADGHAAWRDD